VSNDAISAYIVNGLINGAYQWRLRERPLFDNKLGFFVQRSISANGAQPAASRHIERPLSAVRSFSAAWALCFRPARELGRECNAAPGNACANVELDLWENGFRL
jgi:hypothetical protein